ncbi:hypothetical protein PC120_g10444 [Phytophthora cactorum]|nr:hypothetical protein PC120_g10444 [Phytophthora cactorum]
MRFYLFTTLAVATAQVSAVSNTSSHGDLNGWYPCNDFTFADEGSSPGQDAECAVYVAPLCYPGICETPDNVESTKVEIFVKRLLATSGSPETASNVWLLQGGPGYSSTAMESTMVSLHEQLKGAVNVYTMDHRGTGRSTLFNCVAAQVSTSGSPWGNDFIASEVPTYGTMLVERLIHLAPPEVTGYVLDSVSTSSSSQAAYYSDWDKNYGEIGDAFFALCDEDKSCKAHFETKRLNDTVQELINNFDKEPNSTCAALISNVKSKGLDGQPSSSLRYTLGILLQDSYMRTLIPPVVYRLNRCGPKDINVLKKFVNTFTSSGLGDKSEDEAYLSNLLFYLIVFSEMWKIPTPSKAEMKARFINAKVSDDPTIRWIRSTAHSRRKNRNHAPSSGSTTTTLTPLYPQTHHKYADALLRSLKGDNKELISFDYAPHGITSSTQMVAGDPSSETCGMKLILSYVQSGGNIKKMDKACVAAMPGFDLTIPPGYLRGLLGTDDAYDGVYKAQSGTTQPSHRSAVASIAPRSYFSSVRTPQSPNDPVIADAANFAVDQLRALSDSGIYTTLSLSKIHAAATELGDFHYVIHLQVALASPYFRSKRQVEDFDMMVLESKPRIEERASGKFNATRSIAIDEFPEMDEDAIENFWIKMVEERRQRRHELFEQWEREGELADGGGKQDHVESSEEKTVEKVTKTLTLDELQVMPTKQLRQLLATPESTAPLRAAISAILDERLTLLEQREETLNNLPINLHRDEL